MIIGPGITIGSGISLDVTPAETPAITSGSALFTRASTTSLSTTVNAPGSVSGITNDLFYEWYFRTNSVTAGQTQGMLNTRTSTTGADGIDVSLVGATISVTTSGSTLLTSGNVISASTWTHVAVNRNGAQWALWVNGQASGNFSFANTTGTELRLGVKTANTSSEAFDGYISNFRYIKGTAQYTSRFTPSNEPLTAIANTDLLLNTVSGSNFLVDSSANNRTITNNNGVISSPLYPFVQGSGSFNVTSSNQTYQIPISPEFTYGQGDFTVEFWAKQMASGGAQGIWRNSTGDLANAIGNWTITFASARFTVNLGNGVSTNTITSNSAIPLNTWHHYAFVRNGTSFKLYVDGVAQTQTITSNISIPPQVGIMQLGNAGGTYSGFITDFRIVKDRAVYLNNFTPSTKPLTAIPGTSLLLNFYNAGFTRDSSPFNHTITNTGTTSSVASPFTIARITSGIVTSDLQLSLDAGDVTSYPGVGTVWNDMIEGRLFDLYNGGTASPVKTDPPTYNSANGGYIEFINSKLQWAYSTNPLPGLTSYTIEGWWNPTGGSAFNLIADRFNSRWNYTLGIGQQNANKIELTQVRAGVLGFITSTNNANTYLNTGWWHLCGTYNSTTNKMNLYVNGVLAAVEKTPEISSPFAGGAGIHMAARNDTSGPTTASNYLTGSIAIARIYSTALTIEQVNQNYNAQRARFGL